MKTEALFIFNRLAVKRLPHKQKPFFMSLLFFDGETQTLYADCGLERDLHHLVEALTDLLRVQVISGEDVV